MSETKTEHRPSAVASRQVGRSLPEEGAGFAPPCTVEQARAFVQQMQLSVNADRWYAYYADRNWVRANGRRITDWQNNLRAWQHNGLPNLPTSAPAADILRTSSGSLRTLTYDSIYRQYRRFPVGRYARLIPKEKGLYADVEDCRRMQLTCDVWDERQLVWQRTDFAAPSGG